MVKQISAEETLELRQKVLRPNQPPENSVYPLDQQPNSGHFGYFENGKLVSIASVFLEPRENGPVDGWRLRGMATLPEFRSQGFGQKVLSATRKHVLQKKGSEIWCNARTTASGFYTRLGFRVLTPEPFDIPGIGPHVVMNIQFEK